MMAPVIFRGTVDCRREPGPLGLILAGATADGAGTVYLALQGKAPAGLPAQLQSARVSELEPGSYRITCGTDEWTLAARAHFLFRDVSQAFYAALPPRPVPWRKRLFWRVILWLSSTPLGGLLAGRDA
ncbi:MAG TPA: hypothetical protein VMB48_05225 [Steroidobacteraceae bacterium]|nr:hypothetical protein [Steroidobacteraceae bacterium]